MLKPEARCTPTSSLQPIWDGAVRLECVAVQAVLLLQTPAVQGEVFLSVAAVVPAANIHHLATLTGRSFSRLSSPQAALKTGAMRASQDPRL